MDDIHHRSVLRDTRGGHFRIHIAASPEHASAARLEPVTRSLVLIGRGVPEGLLSEIEHGLAPWPEYMELARTLEAEIISADYWKPRLARIAKRAPLFASCFAAYLNLQRYDAIYTTSEDLAMRFAPLLRLSGWKGRFVAVVHACTSERRKTYLRMLGPSTFHALICVSEAQRDILVEEVGFPAAKVHTLPYWVDTEFFRPAPEPRVEGGFVFSCGLTNRDYATLIAAARRCSVLFKIAASGFDGKGSVAEPASNVDVLRQLVPFSELREVYAAARFAVVPLHSVPAAAGLTGILEAMAAGLAVVVTESAGLSEFLRSAVPGPVVPPRDPDAMAAAIRELWEHPEQCREIGSRNRQWCEQNATVKGYVRRVHELLVSAPH